MEELMSKPSHPNLIVTLRHAIPLGVGHGLLTRIVFRTLKVERNAKTCTALGVIRGFSDDQIGNLRVENRVLTVSVSELKRPVQYFWGVHDFVRGLRGALLGHECLTKIGILHCDIGENSIVLGLRPGDEQGYLIDFGMAVLQKAGEPTPDIPRDTFPRRAAHKSSAPAQPNTEKSESRGYEPPLSDTELRKADTAGFVQSIGSGRSSHMRHWPEEYADWADGNPRQIVKQKHSTIMHPDVIESVEFTWYLESNRPKELHDPMCDLMEDSFTVFWNGTLRTAARGSRTEVSHAEFISTLDEWLDKYTYLEDQFSNSPFK